MSVHKLGVFFYDLPTRMSRSDTPSPPSPLPSITVYYFAKVARAKQNIIRHYELVMMREHEEKRSLVQAFTRAAAIL